MLKSFARPSTTLAHPSDIEFFEKHPNRKYRLRLATDSEADLALIYCIGDLGWRNLPGHLALVVIERTAPLTHTTYLFRGKVNSQLSKLGDADLNALCEAVKYRRVPSTY